MKKRFSVILFLTAFMLSISFLTFNYGFNALAEENANIDISSKSAYLCDANSGRKVFSKEENSKFPIASMCKIMTLLIAFDEIDDGRLDLEENIVISDNASGMGGSQVFLESGGEYKVCELIKSITVASANDASVAIAERVCGSEEAFTQKMNVKAKALGMNNTVFVNCTGLPKPGQYSCAKDVATMFAKLIEHEKYFVYSQIWMDKISHPEGRVTEISNTNKLIRFYNGCDAGKTGYTLEAGHCLCATALRNGTRLISVIISAPNSKVRFNEASSMFNYGFSNFETKEVISNKNPLEISAKIVRGKKDCAKVCAEKSFYLFTKKGEKNSLEINYVFNENIKAPIKEKDVVGYISIYKNSVEIAKINIISVENVNKAGFLDNIVDIEENWAII